MRPRQFDNFQQIGFVLDNIAANQINHICIKSCNDWLAKSPEVSISAFVCDKTFPCSRLRFAQFHVSDAFTFNGSLIATSLSSMSSVLNMPQCKKFYYINDLEYLRSSLSFDKALYDTILSDVNIVKFTRCEDYYHELLNIGCKNLSTTIVKDFNIDKILEIIDE